MKKIIIPILALIITGFYAFLSMDIESLAIGSPLPNPEYQIRDIMNGKKTTVQENKKENGLLVVFSCNTCPFVIKHQSQILEQARNAAANKIGVIVMNSNEARRDSDDSEEAMRAYATRQGYHFPYSMDKNSALADAFGATRTPEVFLFDKDLKLVYKGAYTNNTDPSKADVFYLKDAISALASGKPIEISSSKSIGCTIKRLKK